MKIVVKDKTTKNLIRKKNLIILSFIFSIYVAQNIKL